MNLILEGGAAVNGSELKTKCEEFLDVVTMWH